MKLKSSQLAAIEYVRNYSKNRSSQAKQKISHILEMSNINSDEIEEAVSAIRRHARIGLHFHPDRIDRNSKTVIGSLLESGIYKSQFETHLSSGKLSPELGGPRDLWENRMFGEAYSKADFSDRPRYGALNLMLLPDGPCPRFGSCHLLLKPKVLERCTFTYLDSHLEPLERGIIDSFEDILAALLADSFEREFVLGVSGIRPGNLLEHLKTNLSKRFLDPSNARPARNLDFYIEAQIHGDIDLKNDVDYLIYDPSFVNTETGENLKKICELFDFEHYSHSGFTLSVNNVPSNFRGPKMPSLAARIAKNGIVNARIIGEAAADLQKNPNAWADRGSYDEALQELKLLWHTVVKYGS